jgi:hypothetical protein
VTEVMQTPPVPAAVIALDEQHLFRLAIQAIMACRDQDIGLLRSQVRDVLARALSPADFADVLEYFGGHDSYVASLRETLRSSA